MSAAAFVGGGLLAGTGSGILAEAKDQRDLMLRQIDQTFQSERQEAGFAHQTSEREAGQQFQQGQTEAEHSFRTGEREATEEFQHKEGELTRQQAKDIQAQNETFLKSLPSNNPETVDDTTGLKYTRSPGNGLLPMNGPDGQQLKQMRLKVSSKGRLYSADTDQGEDGETLSQPLPMAAALEQSRAILGDIRTDKIVAGRQGVAETAAGAKLGAAEIKARADQLRSTGNNDARLAIAQMASDKEADRQAGREKLAQMKIDADVALQASKDMSQKERDELLEAGRNKRADAANAAKEPGAAQRIKGDQQAMERIRDQAQRLARDTSGKMTSMWSDKFKEFGGQKQFEMDFADEAEKDLVAKQAGEIKATRTPDQIINDLKAARGGAPAGGAPEAKPAPAPAKPAATAPATKGGSGKTRDDPATPQSAEDLSKLPSGAFYTNPADGKLFQKK